MQDTGTNAGDFTLISATDGLTYNGVPSVLGAPSPTRLDTLRRLQRPDHDRMAEPKSDRTTPEPDPPTGTPGGGDRLEFRRRITNNTGSTITASALRFTDLTTVVNSPGYATPTQADIRVVRSETIVTATSLGVFPAPA